VTGFFLLFGQQLTFSFSGLQKSKGKKGDDGAGEDDEGSATGEDDEAIGTSSKKPKKVTRKRKNSKKDTAADEVLVSKDNGGESKPRIRIKVTDSVAGEASSPPSKTSKKKGARRTRSLASREVEEEADPNLDSAPVLKKRKKKDSDAEVDAAPAPKKRKVDAAPVPKKRQKAEKTKTRRGKASTVHEHDESGPSHMNGEDDPTEASDVVDKIMFDATALKKEREKLDGSFDAAHDHLMTHGPWKLPDGTDDKFQELALATLVKMDR
jgi:hypothetical protein